MMRVLIIAGVILAAMAGAVMAADTAPAKLPGSDIIPDKE